jgi:hypothetical protein
MKVHQREDKVIVELADKRRQVDNRLNKYFVSRLSLMD